MAKRYVGLLGFGLGLMLLASGCRQEAADGEPIRPVRVVKVGDLSAIVDREFPGRATAKKDVELSFQVSGPLTSIPVDVGSRVKKGEVIATIDPRDFKNGVINAQANLERSKASLLAMESGARPEEIEQLRAVLAQAEASNAQAIAEFERSESLLASRSISQAEFDEALARRDRTAAEVRSSQEALNIGLAGARPEDVAAKRAEVRGLESALNAAMNQLEDSTLIAPFDGEVTARFVNNFQAVQAKQPVVRLIDFATIEITVQIPENLITLIPRINRVACRFDALPDQEFYGTVTRIGREASQTTRTFPVTVEINQTDDSVILPGMAARVRKYVEDDGLNSNESTILIVPPTALFTGVDGQQTYVWVVDGSTKKVNRREIKTSDLTPVGLRVAEGLKAGEFVVTAGVQSLRDGQEVRLQ